MNHAIILAAGAGTRMKTKEDKLTTFVAGHPVIYYSLMSFNDHPDVDDIIIVVSKNNEDEILKIVKDYGFGKVKEIVLGGETRQKSLGKGLLAIKKPAKDDIVIVHNGANPLPSFDEIFSVIDIAMSTGACIAGHYISSTVKEINGRHIIKTHERDKLFAAETPQAAKFGVLADALKKAEKAKFKATDEAMLLENAGHTISYVEADENNFKITTPADFTRLRAALGELPENFFVGIGQDSHVFDEQEKGLVIGGIKLPNEPKLLANSDGDVILHAIYNAISQASGDLSIGFYADGMCEKGVKDSVKYLEPLMKKIKTKKLKLNSLGLMLECKKPKIDPLVPQLKRSLSKIVGLIPQRIGITTTSGEEMTAWGAGLGIQCFAIVSLVKL